MTIPSDLTKGIKPDRLEIVHWYCQLCRKQCVGELNYCLHTSSTSHKRKLLLITDDSNKFREPRSYKFFHAFMEKLKRKYDKKIEFSTDVYESFMSHSIISISHTYWKHLQIFVEWLSENGYVDIFDSSYIRYKESGPEGILMQKLETEPVEPTSDVENLTTEALMYYCQVCHIKCFNCRGFNCHALSEGHQRKLLLLSDDTYKFTDVESYKFFHGYMNQLKTHFCTEPVRDNVVYGRYICEHDHVRVQLTYWNCLSSFISWLSAKGYITELPNRHILYVASEYNNFMTYLETQRTEDYQNEENMYDFIIYTKSTGPLNGNKDNKLAGKDVSNITNLSDAKTNCGKLLTDIKKDLSFCFSDKPNMVKEEHFYEIGGIDTSTSDTEQKNLNDIKEAHNLIEACEITGEEGHVNEFSETDPLTSDGEEININDIRKDNFAESSEVAKEKEENVRVFRDTDTLTSDGEGNAVNNIKQIYKLIESNETTSEGVHVDEFKETNALTSDGEESSLNDIKKDKNEFCLGDLEEAVSNKKDSTDKFITNETYSTTKELKRDIEEKCEQFIRTESFGPYRSEESSAGAKINLGRENAMSLNISFNTCTNCTIYFNVKNPVDT